MDDLVKRTTGQVSSPNTTREQRVARNESFLSREEQADATFGVTGGVNHAGCVRSSSYDAPVIRTRVDLHLAWRCHPNPICLGIEHFEQRIIILIQQDWSACRSS